MNYYFYYLTKKIGNVFFWYVAVPVAVFVVILPLALPIIYSFENKVEANAIETASVDGEYAVKQTAAITSYSAAAPGSVSISNKDFRAVVFDAYFAQYNSPLMGLGQNFVDACDKYGAPYDCTILPAIGKAETDLCNYKPSQNQKNCWGFGGSGTNRIYYPSYEVAIDEITRRLVDGYGPRYMADPVLMAPYYCGRHCDRWGYVVQEKRDAINRLSVQMGYPRLF